MTVDRTELEQQVVTGQRAQEALSRLKALDAVTDEVEQLRVDIAALEDEGRFNEAASMKIKLARMATRGGTP